MQYEYKFVIIVARRIDCNDYHSYYYNIILNCGKDKIKEDKTMNDAWRGFKTGEWWGGGGGGGVFFLYIKIRRNIWGAARSAV